jgi:hypothetical protein
VLANHAATVEYQPLGVVGVIGPWNYPVYTPLGSVAYALAAGNAVVFKPSELTPAVGCFLADTFAEAVPDQPVFQVVTGDGTTGNALCLAGVDKVALTGSPATGRKVHGRLRRGPHPVVLELGGKGRHDRRRRRRPDAAADPGRLGRHGPTPARPAWPSSGVYVVRRRLRPVPGQAGRAGRPRQPGRRPEGRLRAVTPWPGSSRSSSGTWTTPSPAGPGRWSAARTRSAALCRPGGAGRRAADALVMREETFGPVLPVTRARDADHAVALANANPYGLGAAGVRRPPGRADRPGRALGHGQRQLGADLRRMPSLPLGGVGESGFGRVHGPDGLREFSRSKAINPPALPPAVPDAQLRPPRLRPPAAVKQGDEAARHGRAPRPRQEGRS